MSDRPPGPLVSCHAPRLYPQDGYGVVSEERAEMLRTPPHGQPVAPLFPPYAYTRPRPVALVTPNETDRGELHDDFALSTRCSNKVPPANCSGSAPSSCTTPYLYPVEGDGHEILYETYRPPDRPGPALATPAALAATAPAEAGAVDFFFSSSGSFNYGHWLVDDLPRLSGFSALRALYPDQTIRLVLTAYGEASNESRQRTIKLFLHPESNYEIVFVPRTESLRFERLYYASPVSQHPASKSPEALGALRDLLRRRTTSLRWKMQKERLLRRAPGFTRLGRRIYVDRGPQWDRSLQPGRGAGPGAPPGLRGGRPRGAVVQPPGRGLRAGPPRGRPDGRRDDQTLFCPPGAAIVHLAAEGWTDTFFWDLAAACGHRYHAVYGNEPSPDRPNRAPFSVDPALLRQVIRAAARS